MSFGQRLAGKTVVVVDDRCESLDVHGDVLSSAGARVLRATNGLDALALVVDNEVHALVSDLRMPTMNGLELARAIRGLPQAEKNAIIVIAVSGDDSWKYVDPNVAATAGFDYHLLKPVDPVTLVAQLEQLLEHRARRGSGSVAKVTDAAVEEHAARAQDRPRPRRRSRR
jgi:CheY-like chemotaxis protein